MNPNNKVQHIKPGDTFGRLTVVSIGGVNKNTKRLINCTCSCGKPHTALGSSLVGGHTNSCGYYRKELMTSISQKEPGKASYSSLYSACRGGARSRQLEFSISAEEHKIIISKNCFYCNRPPRMYSPYLTPASATRSFAPGTIERSIIYVNGVDRINNDLGYAIDNCRPCCTICNESKSDRTEKEFIEQAYMVVEQDQLRRAKWVS